MDKATRARYYAEVAHTGQLYNTELPYVVHLENVVAILKRFGVVDEDMTCAGWLHDAIEDTRVSYHDIKDRFGVDVAELVYAVTNELGRSRRERNSKTYSKIRGIQGPTVLKLADRIANVEYGAATGGKVAMYASEFEGFVTGLYVPMQLSSVYGVASERMWEHLARLLGKIEFFTSYRLSAEDPRPNSVLVHEDQI